MVFQNAELYNVQAMVATGRQEYRLSRVPEEVRLKLNQRAQVMAFNGCGTEIRFNLLGDRAKILLKREKADGLVSPYGIVEVYQGCFPGRYEISPQCIGVEPTEIIIPKFNTEVLQKIAAENKSAFDPKLIRVLLPYDWSYYLMNIEGEIVPPQLGQTPGTKYLAYGSSITHGGGAVSPSGGYAARLAQMLKTDLINLGFAGAAFLEEELANYIAARNDWDIATLELGINVIEAWDVEFFAQKADYFISKVAKNNPDKWIFCTDIFTCGRDFTNHPKIESYRNTVRNIVEKLNMPKLVYICGRDLLKTGALLSSDGTHPSDRGMQEIAENFYEAMKTKV